MYKYICVCVCVCVCVYIWRIQNVQIAIQLARACTRRKSVEIFWGDVRIGEEPSKFRELRNYRT